VAVVLGPAEIAYRAQLAGGTTPSRSSAGGVSATGGDVRSARRARCVCGQQVDASLLATDPAGWVARVTTSAEPAGCHRVAHVP
jgi:hypothetical protein